MVITALRGMDWISSPLVLNTPLAGELLIPLPDEYDGPDVNVLLDTLEDEAARYVRGERAQGGLFDDAAGGDGKANALQEAAEGFRESIEPFDQVTVKHAGKETRLK